VIDESIAEAPFRRLIAPTLSNVPHEDFRVAASLGHCSAPAQVALRARRLAQVVAVCDATTWRILRFDAGLSPAEVELALSELLEPLLRNH
jgi:hypothetical protein